MLQTKAIFRSKETEIETKDCVIDKVISLSGVEFDRFSKNLLRDWDFLRDNKIDKIVDEKGRYHCLLVIGEGSTDGILVNTEGYDYARYSAFLPNVESFLMAAQYPSLASLNQKLTDTVDFIADKTGTKYVLDLQELETTTGIDFMTNGTLLNTIMDMLCERPEIKDFKLDKNELTVYYNVDGLEQTAEDLSDSTVSLTDMYAYGYGWDGMIPLGTERALELFDKGHEVFLLYENDAEGSAQSRSDIEEFDCIFGIENPAWVEQQQSKSIQVFIVNLERMAQGENVGEWLTLPADAAALQELFERIGIERPSDGAFTITTVRVPLDYLRDYISKYDSLDELNMLASLISGMEDFEFDKFQAILTSGVKYVGIETADLINALCDENFDAFRMIDASDYESLGRYWEREVNDKPEDISFEEYGRRIVADERGKFTEHGYIYFRRENLLPEYTGIVPDEYKIVGAALHGLRTQAQELGGSEDKTSVIEQIKAARTAPHKPKDIQKHNKSKDGQEL